MTQQREAIFLLLYSFLIGVLLGLVYDAFRVLRIALYGRKKAEKEKMIPLAGDAKSIDKILKGEQKQGFPSLSFFFIFVCDIAFCVFSALMVTVMLFQFGDGRVRLFSLLGAFVGFTVYYFTVGKIVMLFSDVIISAVKAIIRTVLRFTLYPVCAVLLRAGSKLRSVYDSKKRARTTQKYMKYMLNNPQKFVFREKQGK